MIEAEQFVESARSLGYDMYTGVPCSFLTPFINYVLDRDDLRYVISANEGDAVATAAGAALGGRRAIAMMQNSGLGNAVNPLTSLTWAFRIPILIIVTWRGDPERTDEPQHLLMGKATTALLEQMEIPWELFPDTPGEIEPALRRAETHMQNEGRPYAFIMRKGTVAPFKVERSRSAGKQRGARTFVPNEQWERLPEARPTRTAALTRIAALTDPEHSVLIATTGYTGRELYAIADRPNQLYMVGSMGCAPSLALGLSLARPELQVVVIDGDGASLMRMGNLATIGAYGMNNLVHVLLDNEIHESTGGQATVSAGMSFAGVASACGYPVVMEGDDLTLLDELFARKNETGPRFLQLKTRPGVPADLPRPTVTPEQVTARLMAHIAQQ
jgi:phosphonopyruvate decarboxylase